MYQEFRKKHPHWPKRMRDLEGRIVRIVRETRNEGGDVFLVGEAYRIVSTYRGGLILADADGRTVLRGAAPCRVELATDTPELTRRSRA